MHSAVGKWRGNDAGASSLVDTQTGNVDFDALSQVDETLTSVCRDDMCSEQRKPSYGYGDIGTNGSFTNLVTKCTKDCRTTTPSATSTAWNAVGGGVKHERTNHSPRRGGRYQASKTAIEGAGMASKMLCSYLSLTPNTSAGWRLRSLSKRSPTVVMPALARRNKGFGRQRFTAAAEYGAVVE